MWDAGERKLWIDQLCINQEDLLEKSNQVLRMIGLVYERADRVVAWLGTSEEDSDTAMAMLAGSRPVIEASKQEFEALSRLFEREYFKRMWIIQEVCKARSLVVQCGTLRSPNIRVPISVRLAEQMQQYKADDFLGISRGTAAAIEQDEMVQRLQKHVAPLLTMQDRTQMKDATQSALVLVEAVILAGKAHASNPRDKLYGLLSLVSDGADIIPMPNYSETPTQVFMDATTRMIRQYRTRNIVLLASRTRPSVLHLPSWVPDWSNMGQAVPPWIEKRIKPVPALKIEVPKFPGGRRGVYRPTRYYYRASDGTYGWDDRPRPTTDVDTNFSVGTHLDTIVAICHPRTPQTANVRWRFTARDAKKQAEIVLAGLWSALVSYRGTDATSAAYVFHAILNGTRERYEYLIHGSEHIKDWLVQFGGYKVLDRTIREHIDLYYSFARKKNMFSISRPKSHLHSLLGVQCRFRLETFRDHHMRIAITARGLIRPVYEPCQVHDEIWTLPNCSLPLVLRSHGAGNKRTLVGEVFLEHNNDGSYRSFDNTMPYSIGWSEPYYYKEKLAMLGSHRYISGWEGIADHYELDGAGYFESATADELRDFKLEFETRSFDLA